MNTLALEQQVNLYQPILGAEKRLFSARAIGLALSVFAVCLVALASYGSHRTTQVERTVDELERQEAANLALAAQAGQALRPAASLADLDAEARVLSADIEARQRAVEAVQRQTAVRATGFAARLDALAKRSLAGVWLQAIVVGSGEGRLSLRGAATDAVLVPRYLTSLAGEPALAGVRFDKLAMRHALPGEAPAAVIFELDGPGLNGPGLDPPGEHKP